MASTLAGRAKAERSSGKRARNNKAVPPPVRIEIRRVETPSITTQMAAAAGGGTIGSMFGPVGGIIGAAAAAVAATLVAKAQKSRSPERETE